MPSEDSLSDHDFVSPSHCAECMKAWLPPGSVLADEPPLTPEEEEQVPEDDTLTEGDVDRMMADGEPVDLVPPPQPQRRPPLAVAYSVQGHLYEVALPGDAAVRAVDGALVITHALGPVAGILQVLPMTFEGSASGAEADE